MMTSLILALFLVSTAADPASHWPVYQDSQQEPSETELAIEEAEALMREAVAQGGRGAAGEARESLQYAYEVLASSQDASTDPSITQARWHLGNVALKLADYSLARSAFEAVLEFRKQNLDKDDPQIMRARVNLSATCVYLGDLDTSLSLNKENLEYVLRVYPDDHPDVQKVRLNVAATLIELGEIAEARTLLESAVTRLEQAESADKLDLMRARMNLGVALARGGDPGRAAVMFARILKDQEKNLGPLDRDMQRTRLNLAAMLRGAGDFAGSYALHEKVLETYEELGVEDDPGYVMAQINFATLCEMMGDFIGAEALLRKVLSSGGNVLPPGHPTRFIAQRRLAEIRANAGRAEEAVQLLRELRDQLQETLPADHADILRIEATLAVQLVKSGEVEQAVELLDRILEQWSTRYSPQHEYMLGLQACRARAAAALGDDELARSIGEDLIALCKDGYPGDNFFRRKIYRTFVFAMASSEEAHSEGELSTLVDDALAGERAWLEGLIVLPPRLAWESATGLSTSVSIWLSLCELKSELRNEHDPALFSLVEEIRALTGGGLQVPAGGLEASVEDLRQEAFRLREKVNGMAASLGAIDASRRSTSQQIAEAVLERDRVMARLRQSMVSSGFGSPSIDASSLGAQLPERTAAVGYRAYERVLASGETNSWMTAFVVGADGSLQRIDLGALEPIAAATEKWRTAIGSGSGRGVSLRAPQVNPEDGAREAGADLRERILDPILVAVGDVTALHVCVDSFLHLVPLDALPMGDGVVGDHLRIYNEVSFARLLSRVELSSRPPAFLVIGGVDFDAEVESDLLEATVAAAPVNLTSRGGAKLFNFLPGTLTESKRLGEAFEQQFGSAASLLVGPNATRQAVCELAPVARYFHLATHGYFAGSEVRAWGDGVEAAVNWDSDQSAQVVRGMAPLTLCGLALAGANSRMDSTGSVPGILTAEEIAGLDLSGCELAVLSACQTNVGDSRPGQGIHSLQGALHSAGVGTAMTSLWMVDDDWTQRLMTEFYDRMWLGEEGKAQALWNAKRALRDQGAPLRAWAPWVLTGAPE